MSCIASAKRREDFFYAFVVFAMLAVMVIGVAVEFLVHYSEAYSVDFNEVVEPRAMAAEADTHAEQRRVLGLNGALRRPASERQKLAAD